MESSGIVIEWVYQQPDTMSQSVIVKNGIPDIIKGISTMETGKLAHTIGARYERALTEQIHKGDSSWAPLSAAWAEQKGHGNQWYHTGTLESAIKYEIQGDSVYIGIVKPEGDLGKIAITLEFGTSTIPARPLFAPVADEYSDEIVELAKEWVQAQIQRGRV